LYKIAKKKTGCKLDGGCKIVILHKMYDGKVRILRLQFSYVGAVFIDMFYFGDFILKRIFF